MTEHELGDLAVLGADDPDVGHVHALVPGQILVAAVGDGVGRVAGAELLGRGQGAGGDGNDDVLGSELTENKFWCKLSVFFVHQINCVLYYSTLAACLWRLQSRLKSSLRSQCPILLPYLVLDCLLFCSDKIPCKARCS